MNNKFNDKKEISKIELMMFGLKGNQSYGINVLKIKEILPCPKLTKTPYMNENVIGMAYVRDKAIQVIDLSFAIGFGKTDEDKKNLIVVTEINNLTQAFLVTSVSKIVRLEWSEIKAIPEQAGRSHFLTGVAKKEDFSVSIIDVEKVLSKIYPVNMNVSESLKSSVEKKSLENKSSNKSIMIVDDSNLARKQVAKTVLDLGFMPILIENGQDAINTLLKMSKEGGIKERIAMVVSDIEMPVKDGYSLTSEIKNNPDLSDIYVVLHTSLSGEFNNDLVKKVKADDFVSKFDAELLAQAIEKGI